MANLSNINNKFLVTTGGNVLIGQTSAVGSSIFQVTGTSTFVPISTVNFIVTNSGNALRLIAGLPSGVTWVGKPVEYYASEYSFSTDTTGAGSYSQQLVIENNGDVGIGVSSPIKKLQVSSFVAGDLINILCVNRRDQNGDTASIGFSMTDNNLYNKAAVIFERTTTQGRGSLHFATNNVDSSANVGKADARMTILSGGDVGIGTTSPSNKLDVQISTSNRTTLEPVLSVSASGNGPYTGFGPKISFDSNIYYGAGTGNPAGIIETAYIGAVMGTTYATNSDLVFATRDGATSVTEKMRILGNGNVGIGTDSPDYKLEVESTSDADLVSIKSTAIANNTQMRLGISGNDSVISGTGGSTGNLVFKTYGTERMRIDSTGRTIIQSGTLTAPAYTPALGYPLHVQGISSQCFIAIGRSGQTTGSVGMVVGLDTSTSYLWNRDNIAITFGTNNSTKMLIQAGGNVGIGTTSPGAKLEINNGSTQTELRISVTGDTGYSTINFSDASDINPGQIYYYHQQNLMNFRTNDNDRMQIESDGTVRIKTGSLLVETAGQGIFLGGTAVANKLDDYEEGTWTPSVNGSTASGSTTYAQRGGTYTKIGNQVTAWFSMNSFSITGASGLVAIAGIPFTPSFVPASGQTVRGAFSSNLRFYQMNFPTGGVIPTLNLESGQTTMYVLWSRNGTSWVQQSIQNTAGQYIEGYITYTTA